MGKDRHGANGKDIILKVPVGTQIYDEDGETLLADLDKVGDEVMLASGGNGGFGNAHFKSSTNRAPRHANPGQPAEERTIWLHLKLIADAGLVGLPNAGKSTFLASVSAAKPKIADYPFTTLHPQLGVFAVDGREFVMADLPGLIEGAHEGAGLGDRFLGHVERCRVLLHLVDGTSEDVAAAYRTVRNELESYGEGLAEKPEIVALSKSDAMTEEADRGTAEGAEEGREEDAAGAFRAIETGRAGGPAGAAAGDRQGARGGRSGGTGEGRGLAAVTCVTLRSCEAERRSRAGRSAEPGVGLQYSEPGHNPSPGLASHRSNDAAPHPGRG